MTRRYIIARASRLTALADDWLEKALAREGIEDILPAHGDLLAELYREGALSVSSLARRSARSKSTVSVLVRKLETAGYVRRRVDESDPRRLVIEPTDKGLALQEPFTRIADELNARLEAVLGAERADALDASLLLARKAFEKLSD